MLMLMSIYYDLLNNRIWFWRIKVQLSQLSLEHSDVSWIFMSVLLLAPILLAWFMASTVIIVLLVYLTWIQCFEFMRRKKGNPFPHSFLYNSLLLRSLKTNWVLRVWQVIMHAEPALHVALLIGLYSINWTKWSRKKNRKKEEEKRNPLKSKKCNVTLFNLLKQLPCKVGKKESPGRKHHNQKWSNGNLLKDEKGVHVVLWKGEMLLVCLGVFIKRINNHLLFFMRSKLMWKLREISNTLQHYRLYYDHWRSIIIMIYRGTCCLLKCSNSTQ